MSYDSSWRSAIGFIVAMVLGLSLLGPVVSNEAAYGQPAPDENPYCLDVSPENDTNPAGATHSLTATLRSEPAQPVPATCEGQPITSAQTTTAVIDFEIEGPGDPNGDSIASSTSPDLSCSIPPGQSSCAVSYSSTKPGDDKIIGWIRNGGARDTDEAQDVSAPPELLDEPDDTDVVNKKWVAAEPSRLDCDDQSGDDRETNPSSTNAAESSEVYTCKVTDEFGNPTNDAIPNATGSGSGSTEPITVRGENENGVNDPDASDGASYESPDYRCGGSDQNVGSNGQCTITVPQSEQEPGTAEICFWLDTTPSTNPASEGSQLCASEPTDELESNDGADQVEKTWQARAGSGLDAEPESDTNELGQAHEIDAFVYDQFGSAFVSNTTVNLEFFSGSPSDADGNTPATPDKTCQTRTDGNPPANTSVCEIEYTQLTQIGKDRMCVWIGDAPAMSGDNQSGTCNGESLSDADDAPNEGDPPAPSDDRIDVIEKNWIAPPGPTTASRLDCTPEQDTNPTRSSHTITCTATNASGQRIGGAGVDAEAVGANDPDNSDSKTTPDFSCTTSSNDDPTTSTDERGTCSFTHGPQGRGTTNSAGITTYTAWIDVNGSNATAEVDNGEGRDEAGQPGDEPEPDGTDVVEKQWVSDPSTLVMTPESDSAVVGECNPFTITVQDTDKKPVQGVYIDVEQRHSEANDTQTSDEPTVGFCTPPSGPNPSDVDQSRGDLGAGNENPDNKGTAGGETILPTDSNGQVTIGINVTPGQGSNGSGTVTVTAFYDKDNDNDDPDQGEPQDTSTKTWTAEAGPGGRAIDCSPETATNPTGSQHTVTCVVTNGAGSPEQGVSVTFEESGPGEFVTPTQTSTDSNGEAKATVTSNEEGVQSITGTITNSTQNEPDTDECNRAAGDPAGTQQGVCSDSVNKVWGEAQPECDDGADNDSDGEIDFPDDPGCDSADDDDETDQQPGTFCPGYRNDPRNQVVGTDDDDQLVGTEGDDVICGLDGNDDIDGLGGDDIILGGSGNDSLRGGGGDDEVDGEGGKDEIRGNDGDDLLLGGNQNDVILGNNGNDRMIGGKGFDVLKGGSDNDVGKGGSGRDTLQGFTGKDKLAGGGGKDVVKGGRDNDKLNGGGGNDTIAGNAGNDKINGGSGRDTCSGGPGRDRVRNCEKGSARRSGR